ncbi:MAG: hypothetical protein JWL72_3858, partial [Ilumatobacteraceae bacterium]|nr:hypothetical protein [Ilumatobacteraceae bacterium]
QVLAFARAPGQSVGDALGGTPCSAPQVAEPQGEAIAFSADGDRYFTSGEVQLARESNAIAATDPLPLARFAIAPLATVATTTSVAPTTTIASITRITTVATTTAEPTTSAAATATTVAPNTTSAPAPTRHTTNSRSRWWLWSGLGLIAVGIGLALLVPRRRRSRTP